jgi:hypothetical protein
VRRSSITLPSDLSFSGVALGSVFHSKKGNLLGSEDL